jgi:hypothetical protein
MKRVMFACRERSCPRTNDKTATLRSVLANTLSAALSDRPVCSTCKTSMGVYDQRDERVSERGQVQEEVQEEDAVRAEEARIQRRASDRHRTPTGGYRRATPA